MVALRHGMLTGLGTLVASASGAAEPLPHYLAPDARDDRPGRAAVAGCADGPFATVARARDEALADSVMVKQSAFRTDRTEVTNERLARVRLRTS